MTAVSLTRDIADKYASAEVLSTFIVVYANGWDCDTDIALVRKGGKVVLMGTDHGKLVTITKTAKFFAEVETVYTSRLKEIEATQVLAQLR